MCGIALITGTGADEGLFSRMLSVLEPRGEVQAIVRDEHVLAGVVRLRIVDRERAVQPWLSADGRWLLCFNGEIFNYRQLREELSGLGRQFRTESDTEVAAEAFAEWGEQAVTRFRGEFAVAIAERETGRIYLARDPIGVKPLYWSCRDGRLYLASEVKALTFVGAAVSELPPGQHGWAEAGGEPPVLAPYVDLMSLGANLPPLEDPAEAAKLLRVAVEDSIRVRVDTDLTVGVVLSGGIDSSVVLTHVVQMHPDCVALTIGAPGSDDLLYARRLCGDLGVQHEVIGVRPADIRAGDVREAIRMSELSEYGDIINAVVSVPLFARARQLGIKVVLTGDGSDELFGGYPMYERTAEEVSQQLLTRMIGNLHRTELQRVDRVSMGHGVEARVPYLDPAIVELAVRLPVGLKVRDGQEKWILRRAFDGVLPEYVLERPKNPMSHSSGLHERARLYRPLFAGMHRSFGYDVLEPIHRDFSVVLQRCGDDLDRADALTMTGQDYTRVEHARDLAGALRWNASAALRRTPRAPMRRPPGRHARRTRTSR